MKSGGIFTIPKLLYGVWPVPYTRRVVTVLSLLFLAGAGIAACAKGGNDGTTPPNATVPAVVATSPAELSANVPLNSVVAVAFSEAMNPSTLTTEAFSVSTGGAPVPGTVSYANSVATFTPAALFQGGATFVAHVSSEVTNVAGHALPAEYTWTFATPAPQVAYVADRFDDPGTVSVYWIDGATGQLYPRSQVDVFQGIGPVALTVSSSKQLLIAANFDSNNVTTFQIDQSDPTNLGGLTTVATTSTGNGPQAVVVVGEFVYVASNLTNTVRTFKINPTTGTLTDLGPVPTGTTVTGPVALAVDPTGSYLYAANTLSSDVATLRIDPNTGALEFKGRVVVGTLPRSIAVYSTAQNGQVLYVANRGITVFPGQVDLVPDSHNVAMFPIDPITGVLKLAGKQQKVVAEAGSQPESLTVDPTGRFLYVADPGAHNVALFPINPDTGELGDETAIAVGEQPVTVKVDSTGHFAYVVDFGRTTTQPPLLGNVTTFSIDQVTGVLTQLGSSIGAGKHPYGMTIASF